MSKQRAMNVHRGRKSRGWGKIVITVLLTLVISGGLLCALLGRGGMALMESWLLSRYVFVDTTADLREAADQSLDALINGLGDRWSYYLSEEDYQQVMSRRANQYVGVGVTVNYQHEEGLFVQNVTKGGPAEEAGIVVGDIIIAVNGVSLTEENKKDVADMISGEEGTQVTLTLLGADGTVRDVQCIRRRMSLPSASGMLLEEQVGYVRLDNFYVGSADSFKAVVDDLIVQGADSLVIDLRSCPGGYVSELKVILDYLLPEGPVFTQKSRWWFKSVYQSDASCIGVPMVAIVNENTYSAAEILAAQMRESVGAPIVGEVTSGKGYSQNTFMLPNGGGIGLSTATYCTGSGHSLIGEGITPDVEVELSETGDTQLEAAIALLTKK